MKVAIITDTHYGGKNDNISFAAYQRRFYENTFFPILRREKIDTILHLGDVFEDLLIDLDLHPIVQIVVAHFAHRAARFGLSRAIRCAAHGH